VRPGRGTWSVTTVRPEQRQGYEACGERRNVIYRTTATHNTGNPNFQC